MPSSTTRASPCGWLSCTKVHSAAHSRTCQQPVRAASNLIANMPATPRPRHNSSPASSVLHDPKRIQAQQIMQHTTSTHIKQHSPCTPFSTVPASDLAKPSMATPSHARQAAPSHAKPRQAKKDHEQHVRYLSCGRSIALCMHAHTIKCEERGVPVKPIGKCVSQANKTPLTLLVQASSSKTTSMPPRHTHVPGAHHLALLQGCSERYFQMPRCSCAPHQQPVSLWCPPSRACGRLFSPPFSTNLPLPAVLHSPLDRAS